ncbi:MAG: IS200/IS605 family transposase, partial [Phototrophicales bacterium]
MPFRAVYYHLVWATKYRQPLITPQIESRLIEIIQHKSQELKSEIFAINTVTDHIHVAVSISPSVAVSKWVQQVKGISTHNVNLEFPNNEHRFQWQPSYGV